MRLVTLSLVTYRSYIGDRHDRYNYKGFDFQIFTNFDLNMEIFKQLVSDQWSHNLQ